MDKKKLVIAVAVVVAAGILGWVLYGNLRQATPRFRPQNAQNSPQDTSSGQNGTTTASTTPKGVPALAVYTGLPIDTINEDPEISKLYPQAYKDTLKKELATIAADVQKNPDQLDPWLRAGVIKKFFGDYAGARDLWEYASLVRPQNTVSFLNLGGLYGLYLKDYPQAEKNYRQAIENNIADPAPYLELASLYKNSYKEKEGEILKVIEGGIAFTDNDVDFYVYLGGYWTEKGDTVKAIDNYEKALKLDPNNKAVKAEIERLRAVK